MCDSLVVWLRRCLTTVLTALIRAATPPARRVLKQPWRRLFFRRPPARGALVPITASLILAGCDRPPASASSPPTSTTSATATASASAPAQPRTEELREQRHRMVAQQIAARGVRDRRVLQAMRDVPRHWFVPRGLRSRAYDDGPLPIGHDQTISQPYVVALMTELLAVEPGDKVLEIGTGSGYQAAVLSELTPHVFSIEIVEPLAKQTIELLRERGYSSIHVRIGDGFRGWPEQAPFDAIIVTCAAPRPPAALVEQLGVGGRMVIPVDSDFWGQDLLVLTKKADGTLDRRNVAPVAFVPMTGEAQGDTPKRDASE